MKIIKFDYTSIKAKLIFAYILLAVIPILIITVFSNIVYSRSIENQIDTLLEYSMNQAGKILGDNIKDFEGFLYNVALDKDILYYSQKIQEDKETAVSKYFMTQELISYANIKVDVRSITFISNSLDYALYDKDNFVSYESYFYDREVRKALLEEVVDEQGVTLISTRNLRKIKDKDQYIFFIAMPVKDYITQRQYGVLFIGINESILSTLTEESSSRVNISNKNIIIDEDNNIVSHQDKSNIGKNLSEFIEGGASSKLFIKEKEIINTTWRLINIIDKNDIFKHVREYGILVILISIGTTVLFFTLIITVTNRYSNSIKQISRGIRSFGEGQMDVKVEVEKKDELFAIAHQFNSMTRKINHLVGTLERQKKDTEIAIDQKRKSELKALEAQINPHFIYNTLDMINWIAIDNNQDTISEMLSTLGSLLRYSISNIDIIVILEAEIEWLKKYVYLQKIRFNNSFECIYNITEEAMAFPVHKMILQPAIENAILHGFEGKKVRGNY